ncbi:hypothetical protein RUM43_005007, partial [Polyplax serrata]
FLLNDFDSSNYELPVTSRAEKVPTLLFIPHIELLPLEKLIKYTTLLIVIRYIISKLRLLPFRHST